MIFNPAGLRPPLPSGLRPPHGFRPPGAPANNVPDEVRERYKAVREDIVKMGAAAEEAENNGDSSGADFKRMLLGDMNDKIKELEAEHPGLLLPEPVRNDHEVRHEMVLAQHMAQPMTFTQQQALMYDQQKLNQGIEPEVKDFQEKYGLQDRHAALLNEQLKTRNNTFEDDMWSLDEIMSKCGNTAQRCDLLNMNVRWMAEGTFCGMFSPNPAVIKAAKKFKLDPPAACKLGFALESREEPEMDIERISKHLERSNKPSSLVMMFLKTLKAGGTIEDHYKPVAIGSWLHKQEQQEASNKRDANQRGKRSRSRRRSPSRRGPPGGRGGNDRGRDDRGSGRREDDRGRGDDRGRRDDRDDRGGGRRDDGGSRQGSWQDNSWKDQRGQSSGQGGSW